MDYRDFNAVILPEHPARGSSSNTFVLVAIAGALGGIVLFFMVNILAPEQPVIIWTGITLYVAALVFIGTISKDDEKPASLPTPTIGTLFTLTDDYIAITKADGIEKFMLSDIKYMTFIPKRTSRFDIPKKWRCTFKVNNTTYRLLLQGDYGQWETLTKKIIKLKERYNIQIW